MPAREQAAAMLRGAAGKQADFRIDANGNWYYRGGPVERPAMVRLFASMLQRTETGYGLRTPDQLIRIEVEDAPFVIIDASQQCMAGDSCFVLETNVGESFVLGREHPLILREGSGGEKRPYQLTREQLPALIHRNVYYRLADAAVCDPDSGKTGIRSAGCFFALE